MNLTQESYLKSALKWLRSDFLNQQGYLKWEISLNKVKKPRLGELKKKLWANPDLFGCFSPVEGVEGTFMFD